MVVGIASALFTVLGELALQDQATAVGAGARGHPVRVIQAVAVGIGFLGSGVIFVAKEGDRVRGPHDSRLDLGNRRCRNCGRLRPISAGGGKYPPPDVGLTGHGAIRSGCLTSTLDYGLTHS